MIRLFGPSVDEAAVMMRDQIQSWRAANLSRLQHKWSKKIQRDRISEAALRQLPFGDALRVLDAASMEDDESVQEMWASLLHSATSPQTSGEINKVYVELLKNLTAVEALILNS
jgi:hypothetical protein